MLLMCVHEVNAMLLLSDNCIHLDVPGTAIHSSGPRAAASPVDERKHYQSNENKTGYIIFTVSPTYIHTYVIRTYLHTA